MTRHEAEEAKMRLNNPGNYDGVFDCVERRRDWKVERIYKESFAVYNEFDLLTNTAINAYTELAKNPYCGIWAKDNGKTRISIH